MSLIRRNDDVCFFIALWGFVEHIKQILTPFCFSIFILDFELLQFVKTFLIKGSEELCCMLPGSLLALNWGLQMAQNIKQACCVGESRVLNQRQ